MMSGTSTAWSTSSTVFAASAGVASRKSGSVLIRWTVTISAPNFFTFIFAHSAGSSMTSRTFSLSTFGSWTSMSKTSSAITGGWSGSRVKSEYAGLVAPPIVTVLPLLPPSALGRTERHFPDLRGIGHPGRD